MEYYSDHNNGFLEEELQSLTTSHDSWEATVPMDMSGFYNNIGLNYECFVENQNPLLIPLPCTTTSFEEHSCLPYDQSLNNCSYYSTCFRDELLSTPELNDSFDTPIFHSQEDLSSILEDEIGNCTSFQNLEMGVIDFPCKLEQNQGSESAIMPNFNIGLCPESDSSNNKMKHSKNNKLNGQPSKNLMAERRRRKRLNDRLSMLRSVVPKISKMDRTSILGDTIDYMKELLERINNLQEEMSEQGPDQLSSLISIFKDVKPNEMLVRNSPKFDVERRNVDTRVKICCAGKPGLLLSTVTKLESLGLEIQQCVISCFNDFALQADCSEEMEQRGVVSSEDIKQALLRNAGYGGRCL